MDTPLWLERLRSVRITRGYSERELCRRSGLGSSAVNEMFSGKKNPKLSTFLAVCDGLEVSTSFILEGIDVTPRDVDLVRAWNNLPPDLQNIVLAVVESRPKIEPGE